jgi:cysteine-rich repeat protein
MRRLALTIAMLGCLYGTHTGCASSTSGSTTTGTLCKANQEVYCRCQDFGEGVKQCAVDGQSYGPCLPCPGPPPAYDAGPPVQEDAGGDASFDAGHTDAADAGSLCGNKKVDPGEACDDGNQVNDDGCSSACVPAGGYPAKAGVCPGMSIDLWQSPVTFASTTKLFPLTYRAKASCGGATGTLGSDRVFVVTPHSSGTLTVQTQGSNFDAMLYARTDCATESSELGCQNATSGPGDETLNVTVVSGTPVYVFVDGATSSTGDLMLTMLLK